jgi:hypothetical protein
MGKHLRSSMAGVSGWKIWFPSRFSFTGLDLERPHTLLSAAAILKFFPIFEYQDLYVLYFHLALWLALCIFLWCLLRERELVCSPQTWKYMEEVWRRQQKGDFFLMWGFLCWRIVWVFLFLFINSEELFLCAFLIHSWEHSYTSTCGGEGESEFHFVKLLSIVNIQINIFDRHWALCRLSLIFRGGSSSKDRGGGFIHHRSPWVCSIRKAKDSPQELCGWDRRWKAHREAKTQLTSIKTLAENSRE